MYIRLNEAFNEIGNLLFREQWDKHLIEDHIFEIFLDQAGGYIISREDAFKLYGGKLAEYIIDFLAPECAYKGFPISKKLCKVDL